MPIQFKNFIDSHKDQSCYIFGTGPSALHRQVPDGVFTFGVNDIERLGITPDFLVCVDALKTFTDTSRVPFIVNSHAKICFTRCLERDLMLKTSKRCMITISNRRGEIRLNPEELDVSYTSVYIALGIAYHLGFSNITIAGCDLSSESEHHLGKRSSQIEKHFVDLRNEMLLRRPNAKIKSASNKNGVLKSFEQI